MRLIQVLTLALLISPAAQAVVLDSVNGAATPADANWQVATAGWLYTAPFNFNLGGVNTLFDFNGPDRLITLEIWDEAPNSGGVMLRQTTFFSVQGVFVGGVFAPLALLAGEDYFIGFRNLNSLGVNFTDQAGAEQLPSFLGANFNLTIGTPDLTWQPILQLTDGTTAVPEPSAWVLLALGIGALAARRRSLGRDRSA